MAYRPLFSEQDRMQRQAFIRARLGLPPLPAPRPAQALVSREELEQAKKLSQQQLRTLAEGQIVKANEAFERVSGNVPWYKALVVQFADYERWKPFAKIIDDANDSLNKGDAETVEADKRTRYTAAWVTARQAVAGIAKEAGFGETGYIMTYLENTNVLPTLQQAGESLKSGAGELLGGLAKLAGIGLAVGLAIKLLGR